MRVSAGKQALYISAKVLWESPRAWAFAAALFSRGVGFITTLSLARHAGPTVLALYISTVVTLSAVTLPLAQVLFTGGVMSASQTASKLWVMGLMKSYIGFAAIWLVPISVLALVLHGDLAARLSHETGASFIGVWIGAFSCGVGQVLLFLMNGMLNGLGAQLRAARRVALTTAGLMLIAYPSVWLWGLDGAWLTLTLSNLLTVLGLWRLFVLHVRHAWTPSGIVAHEQDTPWRVARTELLAGLPQVGVVLASSLTSWFCSIYLVQKTLGFQALAVLAVAIQWLNLVLMPATSWSGLVLKELVDLRMQGGIAQRLRTVISSHAVRNVGVTLVMASGLVSAGPWLETAYRMEGEGLWLLFFVSGVAALAMATAGLLQNLLISLERQWEWMVCSLFGMGFQIAVTWIFIGHGLWIVQIGQAVAAVLTAVLALTILFRYRWHGGG